MDGFHWTYQPLNEESDLEQGDFLLPTQELRDTLRDLHPYFCEEKYIGFIITTQTCDLVRRGPDSRPKTQYINIASVRSLRETATRFFESVAKPVGQGIFKQSHKGLAKDFLTRLFNQNEQTLGLFYLHKDSRIGLGDPSVAFLRVTVALKSEHYDILTKARKGRLKPEFQAKLGWLVGNLYSRTATPDWSDRDNGQEQLDSLIQEYMQEQIKGHGPHWLEDKLIIEAKKNDVDFDDKTIEELKEELEKYRPQQPIELLTEQVSSQARKALIPNPVESKAYQDNIEDLYQSIKDIFDEDDDSPENKLEKIQSEIEKIKQITEEHFSIDENKLARFSNRLKNDAKLKRALKEI